MNFKERIKGATYGLFIGDALAMPVHWYYDTYALKKDYGEVRDFMAPKNPHPNSILWRSKYEALNAKAEILHEQAQYWGKRDVHYHQFLEAGENTVNTKLCRLLLEMMQELGEYDLEEWSRRYIEFMTTPGRHKDTYLEETHRNFFTRLAQGFKPNKCATEEKHIGGLQSLIPVLLFYAEWPELAMEKSLKHLAFTHPGPRMEDAGRLIADLLLNVLHGEDLEATLHQALDEQRSPLLGHPFRAWLTQADHEIVGPRLSTACYVEDSVPATLYLALKYAKDPEQALIANTNLGGDNAGRGTVLGALLGAANGFSAWPERWRNGLLEAPSEFEFQATAQNGDRQE